MPKPSELKIGDKIKFIGFPDSWKTPGYYVSDEDREFMEIMIKRKFGSRISSFDDYGRPCIRAIVTNGKEREYHCWTIVEESGWRKINSSNRVPNG